MSKTGSTRERVYYIYADRDVTVTSDEYEEVEYTVFENTYNAVNLSLSEGWNAVTQKSVTRYADDSDLIPVTISITKGDTGRWVLNW